MRRNQNRAESYDDDDDDLLPPKPPAYKLYSVETVKGKPREHQVYISRDIGEASEYDDLCALLRGSREDDNVRLYINSPGGNLAAGLAVIQAMRDSPATVATVLNMQAFSMGALIFLAGDVQIAPPNSLLMFHDYSGGYNYGKGNEQASSIQAVNKWFQDIMFDICCPFLTTAEVKSVLRGRDLWLRHPEIQRRIAA